MSVAEKQKSFVFSTYVSKEFGVSSDFVEKVLADEAYKNGRSVIHGDAFGYRVDGEFYDQLTYSKDFFESLVISYDTLKKGAVHHVPILLKPYLYFLFNEDVLVYIGQSNNLISRIGQHRRDKVFDSVAYVEFPASKLIDAEDMNILEYTPGLNRTRISYEDLFVKIVRHAFKHI